MSCLVLMPLPSFGGTETGGSGEPDGIDGSGGTGETETGETGERYSW